MLCQYPSGADRCDYLPAIVPYGCRNTVDCRFCLLIVQSPATPSTLSDVLEKALYIRMSIRAPFGERYIAENLTNLFIAQSHEKSLSQAGAIQWFLLSDNGILSQAVDLFFTVDIDHFVLLADRDEYGISCEL